MIVKASFVAVLLGTLPLASYIENQNVGESGIRYRQDRDSRKIASPYMRLDTVHLLAGNHSQGNTPTNSMIVVNDSIVYGTTGYGGDGGQYDVGVLYKVVNGGNRHSPTSTYSVVHDFGDPGTSNDGAYCTGKLAKDNSGYIYGACWGGGANNVGMVYKFNTANNSLSVLYSFDAISNDGWYPEAGLVRDPSTGNLYGVTSSGSGTGQYGVIWKLVPSGGSYTYSVLHRFNGTTGGDFPISITLGSDGKLYGTTNLGGTNNVNGIIWRYNLSNNSFSKIADRPFSTWYAGGLTQVPTAYTSGNRLEFWGTTIDGGTNNYGTIYRVAETSSGSGTFTYTAMHNFNNGTDEGYFSWGDMVFSTTFNVNGALYGTLTDGGVSGSGSFFSMTISGTYWEIPSSGGAWVGTYPADRPWGLVEGKIGSSDAAFFGSSEAGGNSGNGWLWFIAHW